MTLLTSRNAAHGRPQGGRARLKGLGALGNFYWRVPMTSFMTSSFVKFMFSLIRNVLVCFFQQSIMCLPY